jgi:uncharacterized lipoprotein NlpE involved in copper resistance
MKKLNLALSAAILILLAGCTTMFTGAVTMTSVVDVAMKDWAALSVQGKTSAVFDQNVVMAHDKYREAARIARDALVAYRDTNDPSQYVKFLNATRSAATALLDLITPLLTTSEATTLRTNLAKSTKV